MTEAKALVLVLIGALVLEAAGILGLALIGVEGIGLSLGAIVPMLVAGDSVARVVMHYGDTPKRRR